MSKNQIENVSDTALWVATYHAIETNRPDGLFKDPLAEVLAGDKGKAIAEQMKATRYSAWAIVIRTRIIDEFILKLLGDGVDTYLHSPQRRKLMKNAPFQFYPENGLGFFEKLNWKLHEIRYSPTEAEKWGRRAPLPLWIKLFAIFFLRLVSKLT